VPSSEEIARCYPAAYFRGFFRQYWKDYYKGRALALRISKWRSKGKLLDVGCALGTMLAGVRDSCAWDVEGLEFSAQAARTGKELNNVAIVSSSLAAAPLPDGSFDYVNLNNVLEHEPDPASAIGTVHRLLSAGGRLELTVPNGPVDLLPNVTLYRRSGEIVRTRHGGHLFFFSRRALCSLLAGAGFKVLSFKNFHFKQGLKSRGWFPNAYKPFRDPREAVAVCDEGEASLRDYKQLIPPAPSWPLYYARQRFRRLFYMSGAGFGCDFKIIAEKSAG
jgi:SAM-dependent methyltransferase